MRWDISSLSGVFLHSFNTTLHPSSWVAICRTPNSSTSRGSNGCICILEKICEEVLQFRLEENTKAQNILAKIWSLLHCSGLACLPKAFWDMGEGNPTWFSICLFYFRNIWALGYPIFWDYISSLLWVETLLTSQSCETTSTTMDGHRHISHISCKIKKKLHVNKKDGAQDY